MWTNAVPAPPAAGMVTALTPKAPSAAAVRQATGRRLASPGPAQVSRVGQGPGSLGVWPGFPGEACWGGEAGLRGCGWSLETGHLERGLGTGLPLCGRRLGLGGVFGDPSPISRVP